MDEVSKESIEQLFADLKKKAETNTIESIETFYNSALSLAAKYKASNQLVSLKKLIYLIETVDREKQLLDLGVDKFLYREDIQFYISNSHRRNESPVCLQELSHYEREIPDDIVKKIDACKSIFNNSIYVLFTDYTGEIGRKVETKRRARDPIVFGTFEDRTKNVASDKCYIIGDWVDDKCDLTLSKLIMSNRAYGKDSDHTLYKSESVENLKNYLETRAKEENLEISLSTPDRLNQKTKMTLLEHLKAWWNS